MKAIKSNGVNTYVNERDYLCVSERRQQSVDQADASVRAELEEERRRYQSLLREFTRLEQRYDNLRDMSLFTTNEVDLNLS